jgi:transcription termination factor Rho
MIFFNFKQENITIEDNIIIQDKKIFEGSCKKKSIKRKKSLLFQHINLNVMCNISKCLFLNRLCDEK